MRRLGLGGGAFGLRAGVSTRGLGAGIGPLSAGTSWRSSRRPGVVGSFVGLMRSAMLLAATLVVLLAEVLQRIAARYPDTDGEQLDRRPRSGLALRLGVLIVVVIALSAMWWEFLASAILVFPTTALVYGIILAGRAIADRRRERAALVARADSQHRAVMRGDENWGVFGWGAPRPQPSNRRGWFVAANVAVTATVMLAGLTTLAGAIHTSPVQPPALPPPALSSVPPAAPASIPAPAIPLPVHVPASTDISERGTR